MKFGGASALKPESFLRLAKIIIERSLQHKKIAVVVSAMANTTDQLFSLAKRVHPNPPEREQDMLVSVGERISISLLAMALAREGKEAVSFTGSQSGIITCENHSDAKIVDVRPRRIQETLKSGKIAIVAGFQGVSTTGEITTLGRGGSDTSAVALAVALGAPRVEFYKDVPGIFEKDPKRELSEKHHCLTYADALELARKGAQVLASRCIELAQKNNIELCIHSFHHPSDVGTIVGSNNKNENLKSSLVYEVTTCSLS